MKLNQPSPYQPLATFNHPVGSQALFGAKKGTEAKAGETGTESEKTDKPSTRGLSGFANITPLSLETVTADEVDLSASAGVSADKTGAQETEVENPLGKPKKNGAHNYRVLLGMLFNVVIPIASSFLWLGGPLGLIGLPMSFISGKIGRRIMKGVDGNNVNGAAASVKNLSDMINDPEKLAKQAGYTGQAGGTAQLNAVIGTSVDRVIDELLNLPVLKVLKQPLNWLLKGKISPILKAYFQRNMLSKTAAGATGASKAVHKGNRVYMMMTVNNSVAKEDSLFGAVKTGSKAAWSHWLTVQLPWHVMKWSSSLPGPLGWLVKMVAGWFSIKPLVDLAADAKNLSDSQKANSSPTPASA